MRTTASRQPSTSTRRAAPGSTSSTAQTRTSAMEPTDLGLDGASQRPRERRDGQPVQDIVEEPEDDEPFGLLGGDAPRFEVVELVVVDGADGAGVGAAGVVGLDLEVRGRFVARAF